MQDQYQTCWNVELSDPTLFCTGLVTWPITLDTYFNPGEQDAKAKADYQATLARWRITKADPTLSDPSNDCLAIARYVYCSYYFPKCIDNENQGTPLCKYVCDMWLLRCPEEP